MLGAMTRPASPFFFLAVRRCYHSSKLTVKDEGNSLFARRMTFCDFMEAVVRVAHAKAWESDDAGCCADEAPPPAAKEAEAGAEGKQGGTNGEGEVSPRQLNLRKLLRILVQEKDTGSRKSSS